MPFNPLFLCGSTSTCDSIFHLPTASRRLFSPAVKLLPLSLYIIDGVPLRKMKRRRALMKENASIISMCTDRETNQVKIQPHIFAVLPFTLTYRGRKKLTPVPVKTDSSDCRRTGGSDDIMGLVRFLMHARHELSNRRMVLRIPNLQ